MLIATFNVNSVRSRLHVLERWLSEAKPDFLFMQETKTRDEFFPKDFFDSLGYESFYHGQKSYNGVAALVKRSISDISVSFGFNDGEEDDFDTRVMRLRHGELTILNTYVPQGKSIEHPDFEFKKKFFARVRNIIEAERDKNFLWLGALNGAPEDIDVTSPNSKRDHVCFCDEIRGVFNETRKNLVDVLRMLNGDPGVFTFFDYRVRDAV